MTQHGWLANDGWNVLTGWDRPLQYHFLSVYKDCEKCEDGVLDNGTECDECGGSGERWLFDNLAASKYPDGAMTVSDILKELTRLGIQFPPELGKALEEDQKRDAGNVRVTWKDIGNGWFKVIIDEGNW